MSGRYLRACWVVTCCVALAACATQGGIVPSQDAQHRTTQVEQPGIGDGGGDNGTGTPAPQPTPDTTNENGCNTNGGIFVDLIGGGGVSCAGESGGPTFIQGGVPQCGYTYQIGINSAGKRFGYLRNSDGLMSEFGLGVQIDVNTCQWEALTT